MSSIVRSIYNAADFYATCVETGASLACCGADAGVACLEGIVNTTSTGWDLGIKESLKRCAKWSLGVYDYQKAIEAFRRKPSAPIQNGNGVTIYDMRPMGKRIGEFSGHMINGGCKAIAAGTIGVLSGATYFGAISNHMTWDAKYQFGEFHNASRLLASGVKEITKCLVGVGLEAAKIGVKAARCAGSAVINNPDIAFNVTGTGAALYFTAIQVKKVKEAETRIRKVGHSALAFLGLAAMVCMPKMNPFKAQSLSVAYEFTGRGG